MGFFRPEGENLQRMIAVLGAVAFLVQGYNQSVMGGFTTLPSFLEAIPAVDTVNTTGTQKAHNATILGLVVAIFEVGSALGALSCLAIGDRLGRPRTMILAGCVAAVGVVIMASAYSLAQLLVGRTVTGFGIGLYTGTIPMYVSETASAKHRGQLVLIEGVFALSGLALASWVNFGMFYTHGPVSWRLPIALSLVALFVLLAITPLLPESPRFLVKKERLEEATAILARLAGAPLDDPTVAHEIAVIHSAVRRELDSAANSGNPFTTGRTRHLHRLLLSTAAMMFAQLTGINVIAFYSVSIFEETLGYSGSDARIFAACLQIALALGGLTAIFVVDRVGRRRLMIFSTAAIGLAQFCVAGLSSDLTNLAAGRAAIFFYFFAMYTMPIGMFIIPFLYAAEIAPLGIRHKVTAMSAATSWLFNFMVAEVTPVAFASIGWKYNFVYGSCSAVAVAILYLFYPETRGRSLEEIDEIFRRSNSLLDPVRIAKELPVGLDMLDMIEADAKNKNADV
ncbi:hypothetical protein Sste5346_007086 [Sporothrix stenoceras]|uniref:Major facilitator superfamily (MFS) profile domain-containing protein n=1 Tax=Sporothrix stenoceras TaxID=5173 RepID=A0ABR3YX73_9PEZI